MMKFKVVGTNIKTAARMVIEVEAQNRASAERAAALTGMEVLHVQHVSEDPLEGLLQQVDPRPSRRGETEPQSRRVTWIAIAIAVVVFMIGAVVVFIWSRNR